jgi:HAD superfamily hydrolase (TIGR01490 family)
MADSLIKFYKGKKLEYFSNQADDFYNNLLKPRLVTEVLEKLKYHKKEGHYLVIVSGSIRYYLEPVVRDLGFDDIVCTDLEEGSDGLLTGRPIGEICIHDYKKELTLELVEKENIDLDKSFAYGNNEADIPFLKLVGNPVAVQPSRKLQQFALNNKWPIIYYNEN